MTTIGYYFRDQFEFQTFCEEIQIQNNSKKEFNLPILFHISYTLPPVLLMSESNRSGKCYVCIIAVIV